jgi:ABC-2 type transport system ATP-binding protein
MNSLVALEARGVAKRYGDRAALRDVDLVASAGQVHGLLGPNGAGKTTLLRVLLGLVRRDGGTVRLFGQPVDTFAGPVPAGVAGFVETPSFYPYLSGRRNLELVASLDLRERGDVVSVTDVIHRVGLESHADAAVAGYSAGLRQRLGLAAALLRAPRLLLLDEPTSSLDPATARAVRGITRQLAADGASVVLSSHDMAEVEELCTAVTIIDRGRVIFSGPVDGLRSAAGTLVCEVRTSDDAAAMVLARAHPGVTIVEGGAERPMEVRGSPAALDELAIALGRSGIAVRHLHQRPRSLESTFLQLTGAATDTESIAATGAVRVHSSSGTTGT